VAAKAKAARGAARLSRTKSIKNINNNVISIIYVAGQGALDPIAVVPGWS